MENVDPLNTVSQENNAIKEGDTYKAQYTEVGKDEFAKDLNTLLRTIVPEEFMLADENSPGDLAFRFFTLPQEAEERTKRIQQIQEAGCDRIDPTIKSAREKLYEMAAQKAGVPPLDVFDTMTGWDLKNFSQQGLASTTSTHLAANGLLVYDKKTEKGIKRITGPESTFKDPARRKEALLAIIGFK